MKKSSIFFFVTLVLIGCCLFSQPSIAKESTSIQQEFLRAGTINWSGWEYFKSESISDQYGIEWSMNFTYTGKLTVTNLSTTYYLFEKHYTFQAISAYQKQSGTDYSPISYGLRYTNSNGVLLKSDNSSLSFDLSRNVNKNSSVISSATNPFGATEVDITAYYTGHNIYSYTYFTFPLLTIGNSSSVFYPNASTWEIGGPAISYYSVAGETEVNNLSLWKLTNNQNLEGADSYTSEIFVEKTTGLVVKDSLTAIKNNVYNYQVFEETTDYKQILPLPTTTSNSANSPFELSGLLIGIAIITFYRKNKRFK